MPHVEFPRSRVFEYTGEDIEERFVDTSGQIKGDLTTHPALLAFETANAMNAKAVRIVEIAHRGPDVRLELRELEGFQSIPWDSLEDLSWELQIEPFEFSRTHIAVKPVDLLDVLRSKTFTIAGQPGKQPLAYSNDEKEKPEAHLSVDIPEKDAASKPKIFISYSHEDTEYLQRLLIHLRPLEKLAEIQAWSDQQIDTSSGWHAEIEGAMKSASAAILLISADFLASRFINETELPVLLKRRKIEGLRIFPVLIKPSLFSRRDDLAEIQALNSPSQTLIEMPEGERERMLMRLSDTVLRIVKSHNGD